MSRKAFDKIVAGLEDAEAYLAGDKSRGAAHVVRVPGDVDVRAIRAKLKLSQAGFAARFGLDARAVQEWEQGRRRPDRATRVLLTVIASNPKAVDLALTKA